MIILARGARTLGPLFRLLMFSPIFITRRENDRCDC
nr:MAG TPA: hypothetical protein [Caudoviricetes sp.]DAY46363.1 MAG TPA: hypothetical protein [Caudoviricetes sp.]